MPPSLCLVVTIVTQICTDLGRAEIHATFIPPQYLYVVVVAVETTMVPPLLCLAVVGGLQI